jgi:hypothetical protein
MWALDICFIVRICCKGTEGRDKRSFGPVVLFETVIQDLSGLIQVTR